jgi:hypothetical protein
MTFLVYPILNRQLISILSPWECCTYPVQLPIVQDSMDVSAHLLSAKNDTDVAGLYFSDSNSEELPPLFNHAQALWLSAEAIEETTARNVLICVVQLPARE